MTVRLLYDSSTYVLYDSNVYYMKAISTIWGLYESNIYMETI